MIICLILVTLKLQFIGKEKNDNQYDGSNTCDREPNSQHCQLNTKETIKWNEFDWNSYITKDLKPAHRSINIDSIQPIYKWSN